MTWAELCEKAKELDYNLRECNIFNGSEWCGKFQYLLKNDGSILFSDSGEIETTSDLLAENRTHDQMYKIMLALK